jgi:hypothetical protein
VSATPAPKLTFAHLSPEEFEALCLDLLIALGAANVSWRKGTPLQHSPSDQGRDIECTFLRGGLAGESFSERYFVECKHHARAVPARELNSALTAASAGRPDVLLFVASGFLSNAAKEHLDKYVQSNRPSFRVRVWESPELARQLGRFPALLRKYALGAPEVHLSLLHPAHVEYIRRMPLATRHELLGILDRLEPNERNEALGFATLSVIRPTLRQAVTGNESLAELSEQRLDYPTFKACLLAADVDDMLLVAGVLSMTLQGLFGIADTSRISEIQDRHRGFLAFLRKRLEAPDADRALIESLIDKNERDLADVEVRSAQNYKTYIHFCERVLEPLLEYKLEDFAPPKELEETLQRFPPRI